MYGKFVVTVVMIMPEMRVSLDLSIQMLPLAAATGPFMSFLSKVITDVELDRISGETPLQFSAGLVRFFTSLFNILQ